MTEPRTFQELRRQGEEAARRAMYEKGAELSAPSYSLTCPRDINVWTCPVCREIIHRNHGAGTAFDPCACLDMAYIEGKLAYLREHRPAVIEAELTKAGVDRRYLHVTFEGFRTSKGTERALKTCQNYAEHFKADTPTGLLLMGPTGTGKTHLAVATLRAIMENEDLPPVFVEALQMLAEAMRRRYQEEDPLRPYIEAPLLVLDDLGNHDTGQQAIDNIARVITKRYNAGRPTIITTNCLEDDLKGLVSDSFWSRLRNMCPMVEVLADDYRAVSAK